MLFILVPLVINAVVFASLIFWTISYFGSLIPQWMEAIPGWFTFIEWLIWPLLILLFSLLTGYFFTAVTLMIASPFNSLLAEKVEEYYTGREVRGYENLWSALAAVPLSLVRELRKVALLFTDGDCRIHLFVVTRNQYHRTRALVFTGGLDDEPTVFRLPTRQSQTRLSRRGHLCRTATPNHAWLWRECCGMRKHSIAEPDYRACRCRWSDFALL
jgi:Uncharacterized protein involved in cysteine biosynthesis